ncbi:MAG TPA: pseudaminic acid synthase [Candidatus Omnitrophota bacterium]|nr:pseudaminic acid synthase [Candidatus Omnitrophota bacterium]HPS19536.1 pseudaminic acid synthase [Candidatus Omnitrophota bacterium]
MKNFRVGNKSVGEDAPAFIIAEISANHGQDFDRAVRTIAAAAECGVDAVKFQTYTPDTITMKSNDKSFRIDEKLWRGKTLYDLYKEAYTPWHWFKKLKRAAEDHGLVFFSTAFDRTAVDLLEEIDVPAHKIASFELVDIPLIEYAAGTGKPLFMSTGMASIREVSDAVQAAKRSGTKKICLLKCVSGYPARPEDFNLNTIPDMGKRFGAVTGLSDHSLGTVVSVASIPLGAKVVEKHFTLSRKLRTPDNFFSLEPAEMKSLVENVRSVEASLGRVKYGCSSEEEKKNIKYRRSLFASADIKKGEAFTEENVRSIRPAGGLAPKYMRSVIGKKTRIEIKKGTPITWGAVQR